MLTPPSINFSYNGSFPLSFRFNQFLSSVILTLLISSGQLFAQSPTIDSLKLELEKVTEANSKAMIYSEISKQLMMVNMAESLSYTERYIQFAHDNGLPSHEAEGLIMKGRLGMRTGENKTGIAALNKALVLCRELRAPRKEVVALYLLGACAINMAEFESAESHLLQSRKLAIETDYTLYVGHTSEVLGHIKSSQQDAGGALALYDEAILYFQKAEAPEHVLGTEYNKALLLSDAYPNKAIPALEALISKAEKEDPAMVYYCLNQLTHNYTTIGDYKKAIEKGLLALDNAIQTENKNNIADAHSTLSNLFLNLSFFEKANHHIQMAKKLTLELDDAKQIQLNHLKEAQLYQLQNNNIMAENILKEGITYFDKAPFYKADLFTALGNLKNNAAQYDSVYFYISEALELYKEKENGSVGMAWRLMANHYMEKGQLKEATSFAQKAFDFSLSGDQLPIKKSSAYALYQINKKQNNTAEALRYFEIYSTISDSLLNEENIRKIVSINLNHQFEKEKQEIAELQSKENERQKAEKAWLQKVTAGIAGLAVLGFGFFAYSRRKNKIISQQNQQLEQLNLTKDHIFAIIGHDLRNPALAFRGIAKKVNYLLKKQDYNRLNDLGEDIEQSAIALNKLTDNLLQWALVQKNVLPYHPKLLNVASAVEEVFTLFKSTASEKNITLDSDIATDLQVYADPDSLNTIIRNLVDNGIKYTGDGGKIEINAVSGKQGISIQVKDTGVGIPEEKLKDIFLLQKNKSKDGTAREKGTGLGLHLIHELALLNKGVIKVASQLGKGTTFDVTLPTNN